jgi:hypothetical protein
VEPTSVHLPRSGGTGTVRITAVGGPVDWTATRRGAAATWTSLSSSSGSLAAGSGSTVTITVAPVTDRSVTTLVIEFDPGSTQVTITLV